VHVPSKIGRRAIEPVVNQFGDFRTAGKRAVKRVVVDPVLREQRRECRPVALLGRITEGAEHGVDIHGASPDHGAMPQFTPSRPLPQ
jgi:hypothetical protein